MSAIVTAVMLCAFVLRAAAQSSGDAPLPASPNALSGGNTNIPVSGPDRGETLSAESSATSTTPSGVSLEEPIDPDRYVCGPGDVFELNFWGQQNFRLRITADLEGRAFISKVGFVDVSNKTLSTVRSDIRRKVRGQYPGLQFDLTLITPRTFVVHIIDNVNRPGMYTSTPLDRVSSILSKAGGPTGSRRRITVRHKNGNTDTADLVGYELNGDTKLNPYLLDGDIVSVPFTDVVVTIGGAVRRPGVYELVKTKDISELLDLAGGLSPSAATSLPARLTRRNNKEEDAIIELPFADETLPNRPLHTDDRVFVRGVEELQRSVLLIGAVVGAEALDAVTTTRRLAYIEGDTVLSLLERAGGIRASGDLRRAYISRRTANGPPQLIDVDLEALFVRRDFSADRKIEMNDTIVVPPMRYSVLVEGAVARPGLYNYNPLFGISEYIAHAGGRTRTARDLDESRVIDSTGHVRGYSSKVKPAPGDAIVVPERNFTRPEVVQIVLATAGLLLSGVAITLAATR